MTKHWTEDEGIDAATAKTELPRTGQTPDDQELRRILLMDNGGSVGSSLGGVYMYAGPPVDEPPWSPPATDKIPWPCTVNAPDLKDVMIQDLLARVQRLEQLIEDLVAKKPKPRAKRKGSR